MNLTIQGHQMEVTDSLHDFVKSRILTISYIKEATDVLVRLSGKRKNGWAQSVTVTARLKGKTLFVRKYLTRSLGDFYATIQKATDLMSELFKKYFETHTQKDHRQERMCVRNNKCLEHRRQAIH